MKKSLTVGTLALGIAWPVLAQAPGTDVNTTKRPASRGSAADRTVANLLLHDMEAKTKVLKEAVSGHVNPEDESFQRLTEDYMAAARYKEPTAYIIKQSLEELKYGEVGAKSAVQVSQAADTAMLRLQVLETAQNGRIIELLEYIAARLPESTR